jgi:hypothetical protein
LQDDAKVRYPDAELLDYANSAYLTLRRKRPDMFLGLWGSMPSNLGMASNFPGAGDEYMPSIADYVTARAEFKDDENVVQQRAASFYQLFEAGV